MMQEEAKSAFKKMVHECGHDIVRMRASFEMYLGQYLVDYPEEKQLLHDAFRVGIPEKIFQHAGEPNYGSYLQKLAPRFAEAAKRPEHECAWGVQTWAEALGRTEDYVPPAPQGRIYVEDIIEPESETKKLATSTMMAVIVTMGGVLGAGIASCLWPLAMMAADLNPTYYGATEATKTTAAKALYLVMQFLLPAVVGGMGAMGGWFFGRGNEQPWSGFSVAFGASMTMLFIVMVIPIPFVPDLIWKPIVLFSSVFAAVYKSAARGGMY